MRIEEDGSISFEITDVNCADAISFEKMMGFDRTTINKTKEVLFKDTRLILVDVNGVYWDMSTGKKIKTTAL